MTPQWHGGQLLDVRHLAHHVAGHPPGAAHLPWPELTDRVYELPARGASLMVFDDDPARAAAAADWLSQHGWPAAPADPCLGNADRTDWPTGPSRHRLWRPHPWLAAAVKRWWPQPTTMPPQAPTALDIACGSGRDAVWLALQGWNVTALDILPDAISRARHLADHCGVAVRWLCLDTTAAPLPRPVPCGSVAKPDAGFDLIVSFHYLQRDLFGAIREATNPGGAVILETFLIAHRDRYGKPRRDAYLLRPGELTAQFADWHIADYAEGPNPDSLAITARIVAVCPMRGCDAQLGWGGAEGPVRGGA